MPMTAEAWGLNHQVRKSSLKAEPLSASPHKSLTLRAILKGHKDAPEQYVITFTRKNKKQQGIPAKKVKLYLYSTKIDVHSPLFTAYEVDIALENWGDLDQATRTKTFLFIEKYLNPGIVGCSLKDGPEESVEQVMPLDENFQENPHFKAPLSSKQDFYMYETKNTTQIHETLISTVNGLIMVIALITFQHETC
ncbi:hypothetical protein N7523_006100 [Penicillium sp. IBT 18751x]|nr:hypothetical protein N7523_006100 [Penicillium sp. IBT 18751x]